MTMMRIFLMLILLTCTDNVIAATDCSVSYYDFSDAGSFELPSACTGHIIVNFDSESDMQKLKILDKEEYSKIKNILAQLSIEKTTDHKAILVQAGAKYIDVNSSILYTSYPPIKQYRFEFEKYFYQGLVRLH